MVYPVEQLTIEQLRDDDAASIISLSASVGWDYTHEEVEVFLAAGKVFGHRRPSGRIVSCAGVFAYGGLVSIGVVIVHPDFQGQGLGRALMQRCLEEAGQIPAMLVSTAQGQRLYSSLGFRTVSYIHKLVSKQPIHWSRQVLDERGFTKLSEGDLVDVVQLDEKVVGANRSRFLRSRFPFLNSGIVMRDSNGILRGFAMTVRRNNLLIVGPVIAPDHETALRMIHRLTVGWDGPVRIDVPSLQVELLESLTALGMHEAERPPVMMRNAHTLPGDRSQLYAIAAQAFG